MDASTLYILVKLASGEAQIAFKEPLNGRTCERARIDDTASRAMNDQIRAKPKLIVMLCTDANGKPPANLAGRAKPQP